MSVLNDAKMLLLDSKSAKALRSGAKLLQNDDFNYGCFTEVDDGIALFGFDREGLSYLPSLFKDVVAKHDNALCFIKANDQYFWVLILDKCVVQSFSIGGTAEFPSDRITLVKLQLNVLKTKNYRVITNCNFVYDDANATIVLDNILRLPFNQEDLTVDTDLHKHFTVDQLEPVVDLKKLSYGGVKIEKRQKLGLIVAVVGLVFVCYDIFHEAKDESEPPPSVALSGKVNKVISSFMSAPDYSGLTEFYTVSSKEPSSILKDVSGNLGRIKLIPGWYPVKYQVSPGNDGLLYHSVTFRSDKGVVSDLSRFSIQNGWQISLNNGYGTIMKPVETKPLFSNWARFHIPSYEKYLSDSISDWWDDADISFSLPGKDTPDDKEEDSGNESKVDSDLPFTFKKATVAIPHVYRGDAASVGSLIKGTPFSFGSFQMIDPNYVQKNGSFNADVDEQKVVHAGFDMTLELMIGGVTNR